MNLQDKVVQAFTERFRAQPSFLARAPGRVNLIGEHTDYNDGFVMPMAIDRAVWMALRPRQDRRVSLTSLDMMETAVFNLDNLQHDQAEWIEYVKGVAWALIKKGYTLAGWEGVMAGNVPIGAGLSSSAAVEMAAVRAFLGASKLEWNPVDMAHVGQLAENQWMGVNSGIMDQMISAAGQAGHALLIDCRTLEIEPIPLPKNTAVVILDTNTRRGLVDSAYNERRQQCEAAANYFASLTLRDVDLATFHKQEDSLNETIRRRARHVLTENQRVLQVRKSMRHGDARSLGQLMNASHTSLRDDFEVSSASLNIMVALAQKHPACYGARMTGAGFGGCAVALVNANANVLDDFIRIIGEGYNTRMNQSPNIYICQAAAGATLIRLP